MAHSTQSRPSNGPRALSYDFTLLWDLHMASYHTKVWLVWFWERMAPWGCWAVTQMTAEVPRMLPDCPPSPPSVYSFLPAARMTSDFTDTASGDPWETFHMDLEFENADVFYVIIKPLRGWVIMQSCPLLIWPSPFPSDSWSLLVCRGGLTTSWGLCEPQGFKQGHVPAVLTAHPRNLGQQRLG